MRKEYLARILLGTGIFGVFLLLGAAGLQREQKILLHARMPEKGGWIPGDIKATVGEPLQLQLTSDDVTHGFAIGHINQPPVDIYPGEVTQLTLTFDRPGKYTYYCTRWCGPDHWRMRGTIDVQGDMQTAATPTSPLYLALGLDIDAPHPAADLPDGRPSAERGAALGIELTAEMLAPEYYLSHSPADVWQKLRLDGDLTDLDDSQLWDLVALIWQENTTPEALQEGDVLYRANCAACHGEAGAGDGPFAQQAQPHPPANSSHDGQQATTNFKDTSQILGASPALLQGKMLRGGMGTGMPSWGAILTEEQTWFLVSTLYAFQFDYQIEVKP